MPGSDELLNVTGEERFLGRKERGGEMEKGNEGMREEERKH